jgi:hypothetical protein
MRAYKFRIYPSKKQEKQMQQHLQLAKIIKHSEADEAGRHSN